MKLRILIVDDDAVFRAEFSDALKAEGHDVSAAPDVADGVAALQKRPFDVVFTDLRMPRKGGLDLIRQVKRRWPSVLIMVVTGFAAIDTAVEAMRLGAFDYVQKPFRIDAVRKSLALVEQEIAFEQLSLVDHDPVALAAEIARREDIDVLLVSPELPTPLPPRVQHTPLEPMQPYKIKEAFVRFAEGKPRAGLVVGNMDRVLAVHPVSDCVEILRRLRDEAHGRGPIAIGFNPAALRRDAIAALRAALAAPELHGLVEAIGSPIRRRVLRRLEAGQASFTQLLEASGITESPKLSFHIRRLVDVGLLGQAGADYRLTPKGAQAVGVLHRLEEAATREPFSFMLFGSNTG
ncbi:MAG: response regulator [Euryarchaeota archaeon]|nr:response regulator [Euryarchaeota archaeon]